MITDWRVLNDELVSLNLCQHDGAMRTVVLEKLERCSCDLCNRVRHGVSVIQDACVLRDEFIPREVSYRNQEMNSAETYVRCASRVYC